MIPLIASLAVGAGASIALVGLISRARDKRDELAGLLDMPDAQPSDDGGMRALLEPGMRAADRAIERVRMVGDLASKLQRARIPLRPAEYLLATGGIATVLAGVVWALTGQIVVAILAGVGVLPSARALISIRIERRRKAFEEQLPEALTVISSSLEAGHTFLHAIEMMIEESEPPLAEEFERVVVETQLGHPLIEALQHMADRVAVTDLNWVVQAIAIQQTIGGTLADVLATLAEFMRAREEVRREVRVLTAEGRLSAVVLGFLPVAVFVVLKVLNPKYLEPMLHGKGLFILAGAGLSVFTGMSIIRKMAKVDV